MLVNHPKKPSTGTKQYMVLNIYIINHCISIHYNNILQLHVDNPINTKILEY